MKMVRFEDPEKQPIEKIFNIDLLSGVNYYDNYRHAAVMGQWVLSVVQKYEMNFAEIEGFLRRHNCHTHLVSMPLSLLQEGQKSLDLSKESLDEKPYFLWICVNGKEEALENIRRLKLNAEDNIHRLKETGFICEQPDLDFSGQLH